ncbi:MAG: hypothetical protein NVSMB14_18240 [Isosphaeraceae bacterium]
MSAVFGLVVIVGAFYGVIRLLATAGSAIGGVRHRPYKLLAKKFRGRCESRGFSEPPTVSFRHRSSNVRVGLAPVIAGQQPMPPRTRVVARFETGLPFRCELAPASRPLPAQPPRGTRFAKSGIPLFDHNYLVMANDPEMARELLRPDAVRAAIDNLRLLAPPSGMLVSINPERLLVQVDRNLGLNAQFLELAVRQALIIHDGLHAGVLSRMAEGVSIVSSGVSDLEDSGPPVCKVCGETIAGAHVLCASCKTPHHRDCWMFIGNCSVFGCQGKNTLSAPIGGSTR